MDDVQTTAKWANRMLRPLTSIYRRLEKHQETLAIIAAESKAQAQRDESRQQDSRGIAEPVSAGDNYSGSDADEDDPVWVPGKKPGKRRIRHKYSGRGDGQNGRKRTRLSIHSPEAPRTLPGAIELATPLITGKRWEMPSSACSQVSVELPKQVPHQGQLQAFRDKYPLHKSPWQELLVQTGDSGFADIAHNLDRVLQNFLHNTRITKHDPSGAHSKPGRGARSLLSMVVRRLPEFITAEQEAQDEEDEDGDEDMCDAYFTELEAYYAPHGRGWKPLREAVRARGIYLVSTKIQNNWVTDPIACALIEKCRYNEHDACEELLSTFLSTRTIYPYPLALKPQPDASNPADPVRLIRKYAHSGTGNRSYIFDELSKLLNRGVLPPEWMATHSWTGWMTRATVSFSRGDGDCAAASRLIEAVLLSACDAVPAPETTKSRRLPKHDTKLSTGTTRGTRTSLAAPADAEDIGRPCPVPVQDALSNQITSLLAALCAMHISRSRDLDAKGNDDGLKASHIINYLAFVVERDTELRVDDSFNSHQLLRRGSILLAHWLLQCNDAVLADDGHIAVSATSTVDEFSERLASRSDVVKDLALFVRQAFRCFGSVADSDRLYMGGELRRMVSWLPYLPSTPGVSLLLDRVAVETAMDFAEGTGEPEDHLWAVEVQETVLQQKRESSPESTDELEQPSQRSGLYRWEESIGEWVAPTPAAKPNGPTLRGKGRVSMASKVPCIPCSTDSSSPESDCFEQAPSSLTSSPSSVGTKRNLEEIESSPLRPVKRRRAAPAVVVHGDPVGGRGVPSTGSSSRSPSLEPVPPQRRILREVSNHGAANPTVPIRAKPTTGVEVVIINKRETPIEEKRPSPPAPEYIEKQVHRTVERRRRGRQSSSAVSTVTRATPPRRSVIPCSEDSEDELSFL